MKIAPALTARRGTITRGVGAGLAFDATGGQPGYLLGTTEPAEQAKLAAVLRPGGVCYDIGANIGFFSTIAGRLVGSAGEVFAFEPFPASARQTALNAELNGFANVTVIQTAVSDRTGAATLQIGGGSATHRLGAADSGGIDVPVINIDEWRAETGATTPSVVIIDAEGAEVDILRGMASTIRESRPVILCEVHWLGQAFDEYVAEAILPLGYSVEALDDEKPSGLARWHAVLSPHG